VFTRRACGDAWVAGVREAGSYFRNREICYIRIMDKKTDKTGIKIAPLA
jgi:hypothetical protein